MTRKADNAFLAFSEKIFKRDRYTCQYCGFKAQHGLEVSNIDLNYLNNRKSNLITSCPFCAQCHFLDAVGKSDFGGGTLIYFPEMGQAQLSALCHVLFASIACGTDYSNKAKEVYRGLKLRSQEVETHLGEGLSQPAVYGQMIIDSDKNTKKLHTDIMDNVLLLPNLKRFAPQVRDWSCDAINALS